MQDFHNGCTVDLLESSCRTPRKREEVGPFLQIFKNNFYVKIVCFGAFSTDELMQSISSSIVVAKCLDTGY